MAHVFFNITSVRYKDVIYGLSESRDLIIPSQLEELQDNVNPENNRFQTSSRSFLIFCLKNKIIF